MQDCKLEIFANFINLSKHLWIAVCVYGVGIAGCGIDLAQANTNDTVGAHMPRDSWELQNEGLGELFSGKPLTEEEGPIGFSGPSPLSATAQEMVYTHAVSYNQQLQKFEKFSSGIQKSTLLLELTAEQISYPSGQCDQANIDLDVEGPFLVRVRLYNQQGATSEYRLAMEGIKGAYFVGGQAILDVDVLCALGKEDEVCPDSLEVGLIPVRDNPILVEIWRRLYKKESLVEGLDHRQQVKDLSVAAGYGPLTGDLANENLPGRVLGELDGAIARTFLSKGRFSLHSTQEDTPLISELKFEGCP